MNRIRNFFKNNAWLAWSIVLTILACVISIALRLFSSADLPFQTFAAILGVIITAIITQILLIGQTKSDITRDKDAKIFEEKLKIYQDYLNTLCDVVSDHKVSDKEKMVLQFKTSYIAMHTSADHINRISKAIADIIKVSCGPEKNEGKTNDRTMVLEHLFDIVQCFKEELYGKAKINDEEQTALKESAKTFFKAYDDTADDTDDEHAHPLVVDLKLPEGLMKYLIRANQNELAINVANEQSNSEEISENPKQENTGQIEAKEDLSYWDEAVNRWKDKGWIAERDENCFINVKPKAEHLPSCPSVIDSGYWEDKPYIQSTYNDSSGHGIELAKVLKWEYKGRRSYGQWWTSLEEPFGNVKMENHAQTFRTNPELQKCYVSWVDRIINWTEKHYHTCQIWDAIGENWTKNSNWKIWVYYSEIVACESGIKDEGNPFFDVCQYKGKIVFELYNRDDDEEKLKVTLKRINRMDLIDKRTDNKRILLDEVDINSEPNKIAERIEFWLGKIGQ